MLVAKRLAPGRRRLAAVGRSAALPNHSQMYSLIETPVYSSKVDGSCARIESN